MEEVCKHDTYLGKRIKRGLFRSSTGKLINADHNGALNIMRKVVGDSYVSRIVNSGHGLCPVKHSHPFGWVRVTKLTSYAFLFQN